MRILHLHNDGKPLCVLGVVDTTEGHEIERKMLSWLAPIYDVYEVIHDGSLFEYPALSYMQMLCIRLNRPCLYVHTRGAYHKWNTTKPTHRLWEYEFGQLQSKYFAIVDTDVPIAACPFTGPSKCTFYNGFVVNAASMKALPTIMPNKDRMVYEDIFGGSEVKVVGTIFDDVEYSTLSKARIYLKENYR